MQPSVNWKHIDLVVFDVDGTLYDQRRLQLSMLRQLLVHAWRSRSFDTLRILHTFRRVREALAEKPGIDFMHLQYAQTAARCHKTEDEVRAMAGEWMEQRPLPLLAACRYPHLPELFAALLDAGKQVAIFSDYPASEKLAALGLKAHPVVCATDVNIGRLKPDPCGLLAVLQTTGVGAERTLMIGDRADRDGAAARRAGVEVLIRTNKPQARFATFNAYNDPVFQPLLAGLGRQPE